MANIKSQKKRILTNEKARLRNNIVKSELKTATRKVKAAVEAQNQEAAVEALRFVNRKPGQGCFQGCSAQEDRCKQEVRSCYAGKQGFLKLAGYVSTSLV